MANYLYNGVEFPALPEWDIETYPFAFMHYTATGWANKSACWLYCLKQIVYDYDYEQGKPSFKLTQDNYILYKGNKTSWEQYALDSSTSVVCAATQYGGTGVIPPIWSNFNILNEDGSVYLAASDPVPVDGDTEDGTDTETVTTPIPADTYIKKGGKVYKVSGSGGVNIITADSKDALPDPSTVPENTIAIVPSEGGGGGLPVVEMSEDFVLIYAQEKPAISEADGAKLNNVLACDNIFVRFFYKADADEGTMAVPILTAMTKCDIDGVTVFSGVVGFIPLLFACVEGEWVIF